MAVTSIFLNGEVCGQGGSGVEEILAKLDSGVVAMEWGVKAYNVDIMHL